MRRVRWLIVASLFASLAFAPVGAQAAAPLADGDTDVQLWPGAQPGQLIVIVSVTLPETTELPATVRIPVPDGMRVDWAGEILAEGDAANDPQRGFTLGQGEGGQYAELELSESRMGQIELSGLALAVDGSVSSATLRYVQTVPTGVVSFSVRVPAGASSVIIEPAPALEPSRNATGESLYTLPSFELEPGAAQSVSVSYSSGQATAQSTGAGGISSTLIGVLVALLVGAVILLAVVLKRQRGTKQS
jgi:hypothetical protein